MMTYWCGMKSILLKECVSQKLMTKTIAIGMIMEITGIPPGMKMTGGIMTDGIMTDGIMTDGVTTIGNIIGILINRIFLKEHGMNETGRKKFKLKTFQSGLK